MSKRLTAAALLGALAVSGAAFAEGVSFEAADGDQDGYVSFEELSAVIPTVSEDVFKAADSDANNLLDQSEFAALPL
ncbi:hypothetical protein [Roseibium sp.]|uniref:hypothetical protein n=1 Tax=Roseibium sp. TaxID=1936156 RepID=UPI003A96A2B6